MKLMFSAGSIICLGIGAFRDKLALVDERDPRCGTCTTLVGAGPVGGIGGTGSLSAHTGREIISHGRASLCRRFAICSMIGGTDAGNKCARPLGVAAADIATPTAPPSSPAHRRCC